jgi:hypothetical protein
MQRAAQKASRNAPLVADEKKKWLEWPEFLSLVDQLKAELAGEALGVKQGSRQSLRFWLILCLVFGSCGSQQRGEGAVCNRTLTTSGPLPWHCNWGDCKA